ncbi:MAG TPA: response regulator [Rubellimicrobium sp.]|nr:response regulator [Rubellimicrobium sp.]
MPNSPPIRALQGRRILVVEDNYVLAQELQADLEAQGAEVLGPVPDLESARDLLTARPAPDAALLDINLGGTMVYPLADALQGSGIVVAFVTGYEASAVPGAYAHVPRFEKPVEVQRVVRWLLG